MKTNMDPHSRVREMKSMKQGVPLSRAISPRKRDSTSMASEYLVLTDIACNLSTYVQNRTSSSSSQQSQSGNKNYNSKKPIQECPLSHQGGANSNTGNVDEVAKLLLNLKEVIPQPEALGVKDARSKVADIATDISPSLSFEASRHYQRHTSSQSNSPNDKKNVTFLTSSPQQCDSERTFSFQCPSLSLVEEDKVEEHNHHQLLNHPPVSVANENMKPKPTSYSSTPSQLFSRSFSKQSTLNVSSIAESLASNLMQSFISALEWRTKVWIRDLTRSLSSKFNEEVMKLDNKKNGQKDKSSLDQLKQTFKKSQEARVIRALAQTRSSIIVHDVRTSFFVLEQQQQQQPTKDEEEKKDDSEMQNHTYDQSDVFRPLKKRRTVTDDLTKIPVNVTTLGCSRYTLSHALNLESQCSVSISSEKKISVSLQTPGIIHGTFVRNDDGDVTLVEMSISLDTQNLAYSVEQKSRFVVRTAAEECIISPPYYSAPPPLQQQPMASTTTMEPVSDEASSSDNGFTNTTSFENTPRSTHITKSYSPTQSLVTPNTGYGDNALVTPHSSEYLTTSDSDEMPPPPPRLPMETNNSNEVRTTSYLNPRRVSPTSEAINVSTMTTTTTNTKGDFFQKLVSPVPKEDVTMDISPPLVSPYLEPTVAGKNKKLMTAHLDREGPALPVLVEVACAALPKSQ